MLASILRGAGSLDRSRGQVITALDVTDRGDDLLVNISTSGDAELEVWAAGKHLRPFEQLVRKPVRLEVLTRPAVSAAAPRSTDLTPKKRARNSHSVA